MRILFVWVVEFIKLLGRRRLHPLNAECPICHQMVRLHHDNAGRRHLLAHARACSRALYEGARYCGTALTTLQTLNVLVRTHWCDFDPRPNEDQHFKTPKSLGPNG